MNKFLILFILIGCSTLSCKREQPTPTETPYVQLAEAGVGGRKISLLANREQLTVGYNPIYIRVEDASGQIDKEADIAVTPLMAMHTMQHGSPVEQPVYMPSLGLYAGAVVFTMPSGEMGTWTLAVEVDGQRAVMDVTIASAPTGNTAVRSVVGTDGISYTIALVQPRVPKIGINDLELLVCRSDDMHHFLPVEGLAVTFAPEMPSMGHGSPNNVDPVDTGNGRYAGKVNFTMTGDWRLHFTLKRSGQVIVEDAFLDVLF